MKIKTKRVIHVTKAHASLRVLTNLPGNYYTLLWFITYAHAQKSSHTYTQQSSIMSSYFIAG